MVHFCVMSGHDGQLASDSKVYLTLMGACELKHPTYARQVAARIQQQRDPGAPRPRQTFVTIMGATELKAPTLAEEFLELRELLKNRTISMADWERGLAEVDRSDVIISSFSLMGGFDQCALPSENEEVDGLAMQQHLGNISEDAGRILQHGIGQHGAERRATLHRAIQAGA
jgi:hypothetical protein